MLVMHVIGSTERVSLSIVFVLFDKGCEDVALLLISYHQKLNPDYLLKANLTGVNPLMAAASWDYVDIIKDLMIFDKFLNFNRTYMLC